jgi:hypothetical protein
LFLLGQTVYYLDKDLGYLPARITGVDDHDTAEVCCSLAVDQPDLSGPLLLVDKIPGRGGEPGKFITVRQWLEYEHGLVSPEDLERGREAYFGLDPA